CSPTGSEILKEFVWKEWCKSIEFNEVFMMEFKFTQKRLCVLSQC
ncbi:hypothetical protein E2320_011436, partial [Naja naja]